MQVLSPHRFFAKKDSVETLKPMPNTKSLLTSLMLCALIALGGCSFPGVYKIDIQQGNVVTQDMIDELRPGMSKAQVRYIMGNPLITDTFHAKRWDYLYSLQTGSGETSQKRMALYFNEQDQLIAVSGDFRLKPGKTRDEAILGANTALDSPIEPSLAEQEAIQDTEQHAAQTQEPPLQFSDNRRMEPGAARPGSVEEQIQRELDDAQPVQQQQPSQL